MNLISEEEIKQDINLSKHKQEYFKDKNIIIYLGDVLNQNLFKKQFVDLIVTSPPYNVGIDYNSNNDELLE